MTNLPARTCDEVLVAVMAALDGERPDVSPSTIDAHVRTCSACRALVQEMTALHAQLSGIEYPGPRLDLWPAIGERLDGRASSARESAAIAFVVAICSTWRAGQLLFEWPMPVVNAVVQLVVLVVIVAWLIGDPLSIKVTTPELRQERA